MKDHGFFQNLRGLLLGKPQNQRYYEEYKERLVKVIADDSLPILCNLNFGHSYPRTVLAYGARVELDGEKGELRYLEPLLR